LAARSPYIIAPASRRSSSPTFDPLLSVRRFEADVQCRSEGRSERSAGNHRAWSCPADGSTDHELILGDFVPELFSVMPAATTAGTGVRRCVALAVPAAATPTGSVSVMPAAAVTGSLAAEDQGHDGMHGAAGNAMCDATEFFVQRCRSIGFRVFTATHDIPF